MKTAFCFAGQGSQYVGQGKDFYENSEKARAVFDAFPEVRDICFNDAQKLGETKYVQPAMLLTGYAIASLVAEHIEPEYCCGLSLGEYTALAFAGVWDIENAMEIISARGEIMQNALPLGTTKMTAIIGLDRDTVLGEVKSTDGVVEIANYNCPGQIVITGENAAVDRATEKLKASGAKLTIPLNVSGAFHSSLLEKASYELRKALDARVHSAPKYKMVYNVSGREETRELNDILQDQIHNSVHFEETINYLIACGVDTFVEIGPGKTLSGFIRKTNRAVKVVTVTDYESYLKAVEEFK